MRVDVDRYLERIGHQGPSDPSASTLAALQLAHMTTVPFENLHVHARIPVRTSLDWSLPKIVEQGRGGWCFELNGAFGALLASLGFEVTQVSAQVWDPSAGALGPPLDHLCLVVVADGERWLVDVGFGDSSVLPVRLDSADEQDRRPRRCRIEHVGDRIHYLEWMHWDGWELQYAIDPTPRALAEFQPRSDELAAGAGSGYFVDKPFATRALGDAGDRVWLLRDRLKVRRGDGHQAPTEEPVAPEHWEAVLRSWFSMGRPAA